MHSAVIYVGEPWGGYVGACGSFSQNGPCGPSFLPAWAENLDPSLGATPKCN